MDTGRAAHPKRRAGATVSEADSVAVNERRERRTFSRSDLNTALSLGETLVLSTRGGCVMKSVFDPSFKFADVRS
jgi:hypothetical protein